MDGCIRIAKKVTNIKRKKETDKLLYQSLFLLLFVFAQAFAALAAAFAVRDFLRAAAFLWI